VHVNHEAQKSDDDDDKSSLFSYASLAYDEPPIIKLPILPFCGTPFLKMNDKRECKKAKEEGEKASKEKPSISIATTKCSGGALCGQN